MAIVGPREGILSNGMKGIGMMATVDMLVEQVKLSAAKLMDRQAWGLQRAREAASSDDDEMWRQVLRMVDENIVDINAVTEDSGESMLHLAAGGAGSFDEAGVLKKGRTHVGVVRRLLERGADPNLKNAFGFTPLDVAAHNGCCDTCEALLQNKADLKQCQQQLLAMILPKTSTTPEGARQAGSHASVASSSEQALRVTVYELPLSHSVVAGQQGVTDAVLAVLKSWYAVTHQ